MSHEVTALPFERVARGHGRDGLVVSVGSDRTVPAMPMVPGRLDRKELLLYSGSFLAERCDGTGKGAHNLPKEFRKDRSMRSKRF